MIIDGKHLKKNKYSCRINHMSLNQKMTNFFDDENYLMSNQITIEHVNCENE
jgi:hypothetical protein